MPASDIFTIGHSTHPWPDFVALLDRFEIDVLIDVRSHPGSRRHPQFNRAHMAKELGPRYLFMGDVLGGPTDGVYSDPLNFPKHHIGRQRPGFKKAELPLFPTWTNQGLYDYGRWMAGPVFRDGLTQLREAAAGRRVAICCCELLWWKCHRSMVADAWEGCGGRAFHLWPTKTVPQRHILGNRLERYEPETQRLWQERMFTCDEIA